MSIVCTRSDGCNEDGWKEWRKRLIRKRRKMKNGKKKKMMMMLVKRNK